MAEAELELRILTGVHAGARAAARETFVIGADAACDIVLCDIGVASRHAEIRPEGTHWTVIPLHPIADTPPEGKALPCGARIALGRVLISLDAANAPWQEPTNEEKEVAAASVTQEASLNTEEADIPHEAPQTAAADDDIQPDSEQKTSSLSGLDRLLGRLYGESRLRGMFAIGAATVLIATLVAFMQGFFAPTPLPQKALARPSVQRSEPTLPPVRADIRRIEEIIAQPREGANLRVELLRNGRAQVSGFVRDEEQNLAVANALSGVQPRPAMRVHIETELATQAQRWSGEVKKDGWVLSYLGAGNFRLSGTAVDEKQRDQVLQSVREEFPMAVSLTHEVRVFKDVLDELGEKLRNAAIPNIQMRWIDEQMELSLPRLTPSQARLLEELLIGLFRETKGRLRFRVRAALTTPPREISATTEVTMTEVATLPFRIRSITGGPAASIRLEDGRIVMLGGTVDGYTLTRVEPTQIILDGPTRIAIRR